MTKKKAGETSQEEVSIIYIYVSLNKRLFDKEFAFNYKYICPCFKSIWFPAFYWKVFEVRVRNYFFLIFQPMRHFLSPQNLC